MEFELTKATATFENFNPRVEKDGPDKVPAADLKISVAQSADVLAFFSPTLKAFYFDEKGPRDLAEGMPLRDPHAVYPHARDEELTGATVTIDFGVGQPMVFQDAKVNQFRLEPMNGGAVVVDFRVQCRPNEAQAGKLYLLQETGITISVVPPALPTIKEAA